MSRYAAKAIASAGVSLAVVAGFYFTQDINCLWGFVALLPIWVWS